MLIRALMVLLVVLNLGVAGWWLSRTAPAPPVPRQPDGVALLELTKVKAAVAPPEPVPTAEPVVSKPVAAVTVDQAPAPSEATPAPAAKSAVAAVAPVQPVAVCLALGPFADQADARAAQARLQPAPRSASLRDATPPPKSYAVRLDPLADRAAAQAMIERITAAGFNDFMIISTGPLANGVALGRYGSRASAERRQAELKAAGFAAQLEPVGQDGAVQWWLDVSLAAGDAELARTQAKATRALPRECG